MFFESLLADDGDEAAEQLALVIRRRRQIKLDLLV